MAGPGLHHDWQSLVRMLDAWGRSAEPRGNHIAVTLDAGRVVHVVVAPDDLDMLRVAIGDLPHLFRYVTERLGSMPDDCDFLVYTQYDLEPSTARHLPSAPDVPDLPEVEGGRWLAHDPAGTTESARK